MEHDAHWCGAREVGAVAHGRCGADVAGGAVCGWSPLDLDGDELQRSLDLPTQSMVTRDHNILLSMCSLKHPAVD
eukprot:1684081-Rhodomonas_salina.1